MVLATSRYLIADPRRPLALFGDALRARASENNTGLAGAHPESGGLATRTVNLTPEQRNQIRVWREKRSTRISSAVALMAVTTRALAHVHIDLAPFVHVVVDSRRYSPTAVDYLGNLAVGLNLPFTAPYDPDVLNAELGRAIFSGRPLAAIMAISAGETVAQVKQRLSIQSRGFDSRMPAETIVSFSHLLGLHTMPDGQWINGFDKHYISVLSEPVGGRGIAVLMPQLGDGYDISASFDPAYHNPEVIQAALDLIAADPFALLDNTDVLMGEEVT